MFNETRAALFLVALAPLGSAQEVIFQETFESGVGGWTLTGNSAHHWLLVDESHNCMQFAMPFPTSDQALWAGVEAYCNFDVGFGIVMEATTTNPISLPAGATDLSLSFWSYDEVECHSCGIDPSFS